MYKGYILVTIFLLFALAGRLFTIQALSFPEPGDFVNDFAQVLSAQTRDELEQKLVQLEEETTVEIAVVTVSSLNDTTIEDYAVRLFEDWEIGKKGQDNGALLLVVPNEREVKIEVGYGLEPILTDSKAGRVIREVIIPRFKEDDYGQGIVNGVDAVIKIVQNKEADAVDDSSNTSETSIDDSVGTLLFIGAMILTYFSAFWARSKRIWPGGIVGAILGGVLGWVTFAVLAKARLFALIFGVFGLILDTILSKNYRQRKQSGLPTSWFRSGGGFWSGGGPSRGFGGFGGGRSGGGGATGKW